MERWMIIDLGSNRSTRFARPRDSYHSRCSNVYAKNMKTTCPHALPASFSVRCLLKSNSEGTIFLTCFLTGNRNWTSFRCLCAVFHSEPRRHTHSGMNANNGPAELKLDKKKVVCKKIFLSLFLCEKLILCLSPFILSSPPPFLSLFNTVVHKYLLRLRYICVDVHSRKLLKINLFITSVIS